MLKFWTPVFEVIPVDGYPLKTDAKCNVETKERIEILKAMVGANGHYSETLIWDLHGHDTRRIHMLYSNDYRNAEPLAKSKFHCLLGAGASGTDILIDITSTAVEVYM